jgi:hypothetical protein
LDFHFRFQEIGQNDFRKWQNRLFLSLYRIDSDEILHLDAGHEPINIKWPIWDFRFRFKKAAKMTSGNDKIDYFSAIISNGICDYSAIAQRADLVTILVLFYQYMVVYGINNFKCIITKSYRYTKW